MTHIHILESEFDKYIGDDGELIKDVNFIIHDDVTIKKIFKPDNSLIDFLHKEND